MQWDLIKMISLPVKSTIFEQFKRISHQLIFPAFYDNSRCNMSIFVMANKTLKDGDDER